MIFPTRARGVPGPKWRWKKGPKELNSTNFQGFWIRANHPGCIGNLRNGEEGERWKECQPLKRVQKGLIPQPPLWSELRLGTVPAGTQYEWDSSLSQGLKCRRHKEERGQGVVKGRSFKKNHFTLVIRSFHSDPSPQKKKASLTDPRVNRRVVEVSWRRREKMGWDRMGWEMTQKGFSWVAD